MGRDDCVEIIDQNPQSGVCIASSYNLPPWYSTVGNPTQAFP